MWTKSCIVKPCVVLVVALLTVVAGVASSVQVHSSAAQTNEATELNSRRAGPIAIGKPLSVISDFEVTGEREIDATTLGYELSRDGEVVAIVGTAGGPEAPINLIIVVSSEFQTAEGIGPGSQIAVAESAYGTAILSYDPNGIGLEELTVSSAPPGLQFFTSPSPEPEDGVYPVGRFATTNYRVRSTIDSIWIDCRTGPCPQARPAEPQILEAPDEPVASAADTSEPAPAAPVAEQPTSSTSDEPLAATGLSDLSFLVGLAVLGAGMWTIGVRNILRLAARDKLLTGPI